MTASLNRKPSCLHFAIPAGVTPACGRDDRPGAVLANLESTNITYEASETVADVHATVAGLALGEDKHLDVHLEDVPRSLGASLLNSDDSLDVIRVSADDAALGTGRVALIDDVSVDIGLATGDELLDEDGVFVRAIGTGPNARTHVVTRISDLREAEVELDPLDALVRGDGVGPALSIDAGILPDFSEPSGAVSVSASMSARPQCMRFTVQSSFTGARCGVALPTGVQRDDAANIVYEGPGTHPDVTVAVKDLAGLPAGRDLELDLDDLPDALMTTIQESTDDTTVEEVPVVGFVGLSTDVDHATVTTTGSTRYINARAVGQELGRIVLRLRDGDTAAEIDPDNDGVFVDERVTSGSPDKGLFARVTDFERIRLDLVDGERKLRLFDDDDEPLDDILDLLPTSLTDLLRLEYDVDFRSSGDRPFEARFHNDPEDEDKPAERAAVEVSRTPRRLDLHLQHEFDGLTNLDVERIDDVGDAPSLSVALRDLAGERTDATVDAIPESLHLCVVPDDGCGVNLLPEDEVNFDLTARLRTSDEVTINVERCEQNGTDIPTGDAGDCGREDGPEDDDGTKAVYVRDLSVNDLDFQMGKGHVHRDDNGSERIPILGIDTNGTAFGAHGADEDDDNLEIIDFEDEEKIVTTARGLRFPLEADNRIFGIDKFILPIDAGEWEDGTLLCPSDTDLVSFFVNPPGLFNFVDAHIDNVLCSNR